MAIIIAHTLIKSIIKLVSTLCSISIDMLAITSRILFSRCAIVAHFHITGCVNKQNICYWCGVNPRGLHQRPLDCERVTVWCVMSVTGIIGPDYFRKPNVQFPWMELITATWSNNFSFQVSKKWMLWTCGFSKMEPEHTQHETQWISCDHLSPTASSLSEAISNDQHALQIWLHVTSF